MAYSRNENWAGIWKAASANTISLLKQIQLLKMAYSRNENWAGDMFGLLAEQWWHLRIFFLLSWDCETCMRSIYSNILPLQCNFFPGLAIVSKLSCFKGIGNPTDIHGSWGTWLRITEIPWTPFSWKPPSAQCENVFQRHFAILPRLRCSYASLHCNPPNRSF